jgi:hypothetical protein
MRRWLVVVVAMGVLGVAPAAGAEEGTHFVVEVQGGLAGSSADYLDLGFSFGGTVGIGGKLRGFPPRFYAIGSYRSSFFTGEGRHAATGVLFDAWQADHELTAGLRVVLPLWSRVFRLFGEARGGTLGHTATLHRRGGRALEDSSWTGVFVLAGGLQARWHPNASFGLALEWAVADRDRDLVTAAAGAATTGTQRTALYLSNTWYF